MGVVHEIKEAVRGMKSLLVGLKITGREFVRPEVTVHYPRKVVENEHLVTFRGHIELVGAKNDPATPRCITCLMCQSVCPSGCIKIVKQPPPKKDPAKEAAAPPKAYASGLEPKTSAKPPAKEKPVKTPKGFILDYNLCSLCGLCVQACPVDSLRFSTDIYLADYSKKSFVFDLMARLKAQAAEAAAAAPTPEKAQPEKGQEEE
ncbi:4Fe-4S ferredoxin, iron-sulpur binding domain-containing protein [Desulfovibrio sp. X2]|uniref:4Fe-4S binding protein n=1 Tax=Desulfovibrio sp. X2 TaxID=941449 RepID=UPI000358B4D6|nr:4Fe-4S binding protein [Desulfovibrio sp. X2]EPR43621.1 4Fe-4S ferredoxin, iron-sulpur binding domain-containing protein [Desulfovibrio sp. X2]